ncbi:MAG: hypothetical protein GXP55_19255 [Deltaproteobacteria bacterium]|nr:hypothetical protein [Deltaproteobacteria bacterium]
MSDAGDDGSTICSADSDCDDGLFCDGAELCLPADPDADALGCVAADGACGSGDLVGAMCTDAPSSYTCTCPAGFEAPAMRGTCSLTDAHLASLTPSVGALSPTFDAGVLTYELTLPPGEASVAFTPTVAYPDRSTIRVDGVVVASGTSSLPVVLTSFAPVPVTVEVTTESGATLTYTVVLARSSSYLKASNTGPQEYRFGRSVVSADGSTLAVGGPGESSNATGIDGDQANTGAGASGAVYVFTRTGSTWSQQAYVKASNTDRGDRFGDALALSADGSMLAVGAGEGERSNAIGVDGDQADNSAYLAGAVYVFTRTAGSWSQEAYVKASNTEANDNFGWSVALSGDGSTLAVGATGERSQTTGIDGDQTDNSSSDAGAVYVFARTAGGVWSQQAYVKASNANAGDWFGWSLALASDGSTLAVGAVGESSNATGVGGVERRWRRVRLRAHGWWGLVAASLRQGLQHQRR